MTQCVTHHAPHPHVHRAGCEHLAVKHHDHVDYLHDGHLHHVHDGHIDDHRVKADDTHPAACTPDHECGTHRTQHAHGPDCGHLRVPHEDHEDYWVEGHLHHPHDGHCDDHGPLQAV